ncbi:lytic transglycosylase domain-containing protein [Telmatospirillum sp.]|uniref:lytic transglycosylase domain-containing protein n=1 Tax=Telmatospirillum sp. TaxID=2079197 RepID=UPI00284420D9|nr:lytic transglycosylase domain-containing protein [Telmatospirillum sp.]MDR3435972.1 lytic transglycosylase domain-containing protein [Telmatospirillum sp.]
MLKSRLLQAFLALVLTTMAAQSAWASEPTPAETDAGNQLAAINGAAGKLGRQAAIPSILSESDVQFYQSAFDAQDRGLWAAADRDIARLHDPLLVGHLLAQRYLSPAYRTQAEELSDWMSRYADLPEAPTVYELARQRLSGKLASLRPPAQSGKPATASTNHDDDPIWEEFSVESNRELSPADRRHLQDIKERFRTLVHQNKFDAAVTLFQAADTKRLFDQVDFDELKTVLAIAYFSQGQDSEALKLAGQAADRSGDVLPEAHWVAGLAMWRSGSRDMAAARHFEAVGNATDVSSWLISAGAYWAARANLTARHPELVNHWLQRAAAYPRTFYGLLARRALGEDIQYSWDTRPFTDLDGETLSRVPAARRALALMQIGDRSRAEDELRRLAEDSTGPALTQSMLALSHTAGLPSLALALGSRIEAKDGRYHDSADYPLPDWRPASGWSIDRALLLAIARQESSFNPRAKSPAGAVGLMQLMPRTAKSMGAGKLTDPQVNLDLGQRYVRHLLDDETIKGNLLFLAASYNSGPGNVARWLQTVQHNGDALLFMESIPVQETRAFVERVMTNFWAYRNRLGQTSPSLDSIAAGDWPLYDGDGSKIQTVKHVQN